MVEEILNFTWPRVHSACITVICRCITSCTATTYVHAQILSVRMWPVKVVIIAVCGEKLYYASVFPPPPQYTWNWMTHQVFNSRNQRLCTYCPAADTRSTWWFLYCCSPIASALTLVLRSLIWMYYVYSIVHYDSLIPRPFPHLYVKVAWGWSRLYATHAAFHSLYTKPRYTYH